MTIKGPGGRKKIHEISVNEVVVEIWIKSSLTNSRKYFDITISQKYYYQEEEELGEYVQLRYINDALQAILKAETWIYSNRERYYEESNMT